MIIKKIAFIMFFIFFLNCTENTIKPTQEIENKVEYIDKTQVDISDFDSIPEQIEVEKKKVILIPSYNGYDCIQLGYNLNLIFEEKLKESNSINFIPFPYKKMNGSGYQSVYDKKYCNKIIEKTDADYLIMTKLTGNLLNFLEKDKVWGYETKILNVKTMEQQVSIKASNLKSYEEIETDIETNIRQLVLDLN